MSEPWSHQQGAAPAAVPHLAGVGEHADAADELAVLDGLELDLSTVEQAIEQLDQLRDESAGPNDNGPLSGEMIAAQVLAVVPAERFGGTSAVEPGAAGSPSAAGSDIV